MIKKIINNIELIKIRLGLMAYFCGIGLFLLTCIVFWIEFPWWVALFTTLAFFLLIGISTIGLLILAKDKLEKFLKLIEINKKKKVKK